MTAAMGARREGRAAQHRAKEKSSGDGADNF
jgi:hypothetical protein